jgi:hypothetical protein
MFSRLLRHPAKGVLRLSVCASPNRFAWRGILGQVGKHDWRAIGKLGDDAYIAAHRLDRFSARRKQQVAAIFESRNAVLSDSKSLSEACLRELAGLAQIAQAHFFCYQFRRAILDFFPLGWTEFPNDCIHAHGHAYVPFAIRARCAPIRRRYNSKSKRAGSETRPLLVIAPFHWHARLHAPPLPRPVIPMLQFLRPMKCVPFRKNSDHALRFG